MGKHRQYTPTLAQGSGFMWGQAFHTLTPTLHTLTCVPLGFSKPLLNTNSTKNASTSQGKMKATTPAAINIRNRKSDTGS